MKKFISPLVLCYVWMTRGEAFGTDFQRGVPQGSVPKCGIEYLFGSCDELNLRQPIFRKYEDGTWLPNTGQIIANKSRGNASNAQVMTEAQKQDLSDLGKQMAENSPEYARAIKIFEKTKKTVMSVILDGKSEEDPSLTENQLQLLNRLKTVNMIIASDLGTCANSTPTAGYTPGLHTIYLCSATARSPENTLFYQLAHEFGHVVDPCIVRQGLYKVKKEFPQIPICNHPNLENSKTRTAFSKTKFTVATSDQEGQNMPFPPEKGLIECGFVEPIASAKPILASDHTTHSLLMDCVRKHIKSKLDNGFDIREYYRGRTEDENFQDILNASGLDTPEKIKSYADTPEKQEKFKKWELETRERYRAQMFAIQKDLELMHESNKGKMLNCSATTKTQETFADLLATRAFEVKLNNERVDKLSKEEAQNATMFFVSLECANQQSGGQLAKRTDPSYPSFTERMLMAFQNQRIQKALGCHYEGPSICEFVEGQGRGLRKNGYQ